MVRSSRSANRKQKEATGVDSLTVTVAGAADIINRILPRFSRATRNTKPRCLHFASSPSEFQYKYPDHFFCAKCDNLYQKFVVEGDANQCSVHSRRFLCEASHENFIFPSQLKPIPSRLLDVMDDDYDSYDDSSIESYYGSDDDNNNNNNINNNATPTTTTTTTSKTSSTRKDLKRNIATLEVEANKTNLLHNRTVKQLKHTSAEDAALVAQMLGSYKARILELTAKVVQLELVIKEKNAYIIQQGKQLHQNSKQFSTVVSSAITHDQQQYQLDLNNKSKLLMRLINLYDSTGSFHNFNQLKKDTPSMQRKRCNKFVQCMLGNRYDGVFGGIIKDVLIDSVTKHYKEQIFNPYLLLKQMDLSNHVLSLSAIELLRSMVPVDKGSHRNLFPSSSSIQLVAAIVSKRGRLEVPYVSDHLPPDLGGGERVVWDPGKVLQLVVVATGLSKMAKTEHVEFSVGMDGTRLYPGATLVVGGIKNNSPYGHTPITKIPNTKLNHDGTYFTGTQSCENQIVTQICIASETKALMKSEFVALLLLYKAETLAATKKLTSTILVGIYLAFVLAIEGDLSGHWKCNGVGGAAKVANNPCHCCLVTTASLLSYSHNYVECQWCSELERIGWVSQDEFAGKEFKCLHRKMLNTKLLPTLKQQLQDTKLLLPRDYVFASEPAHLRAPLDFNNPTSIDVVSAVNICYDINNITSQEENSYFGSVVHDLLIRGQPPGFRTTSLEAQADLRAIMVLEKTITRVEAEILFIENNAANSAYLTENACPCSLHLEMRIMLKLATTIIRDGLKRACYNSRTDLQAAKAYVARVESVLKTQILGKVGRPHSYTIPFVAKDRVISDLNMSNGPCRKILDKFDLLIDVCITESGEKDNGLSVQGEVDQWKLAIGHYRKGLHILLSKVDCSVSQILVMQNNFDMFAQIIIFKLGYDKEIVTNYMHLIYTGHMAEYMVHLKCLYRHSQQGWEHLMGNLKQYCFRRSNRGGGKGSGNRLEAIIHHRSRLFGYMTGETLDEMKQKLKKHRILTSLEEVENMTFPVLGQNEVEDRETDNREDLILQHKHNEMQEV